MKWNTCRFSSNLVIFVELWDFDSFVDSAQRSEYHESTHLHTRLSNIHSDRWISISLKSEMNIESFLNFLDFFCEFHSHRIFRRFQNCRNHYFHVEMKIENLNGHRWILIVHPFSLSQLRFRRAISNLKDPRISAICFKIFEKSDHLFHLNSMLGFMNDHTWDFSIAVVGRGPNFKKSPRSVFGFIFQLWKLFEPCFFQFIVLMGNSRSSKTSNRSLDASPICTR